jgi:N-acetylmuramoyl-L-alanine amidase
MKSSARRAGLVAALAALAGVALASMLWRGERADVPGGALIGEARTGALTLALPEAVGDIAVSEAKVPGRPIVLIDAGHGGRDPGATSQSGRLSEKALTLELAIALRDLLVKRGRVRVALTREDDRYLTLDQRAAAARRLGAALFVSLHGDSAPNPLARGTTVYSLSDVASSAEAARFAAAENQEPLSSEPDGSVRAILADLALRGQMEQSAALADRLVRRARGPVLLRPRPHQFADFHVLRRAATPAVLVEVGYLSNVDDEAMLADPRRRAALLLALAQAIEADIAARRA